MSEAHERQQKNIAWLTRPQREPVDLPPLVKPTYISQEKLDKRIKFLYDDSIALKEQRAAEAQNRYLADQEKEAFGRKTRTISEEDESALISRLYEQTLERKERNFKELYENETRQYVRTQKTISPSTEKEYIEKLYQGGMDREREKRIKLFQQFVLDRRPPPLKRSAAKIRATSEKLSQKE